MDTYRIELYPIDRFYFGSDVTFGAENENYFVRSVYFPQQTTILGMLRYYLLQENNLLFEKGKVKNKRISDRLIGKTGFDAYPEIEPDFGVIKNLSPVFITGPDGEYFVQSREFGFQIFEDEVSGDKKKELIPLKLKNRKGKTSFGNEKICYFEGFNSKTEIPDLLVNARSGHMRYFDYKNEGKHDTMNGIFMPHEQVGIRLPDRKNSGSIAENEEEDDKGFYRQIGYTMLPGYGFAFYAELEKRESDRFKDGLVRMGADQSWFRIKISYKEGSDHSIQNNFSAEQNETSLVKRLYRKVNDFEKKVVLLSDCYIEKEKYDKCLFASVSTIQFRYLKTIESSDSSNQSNKNKPFDMDSAGFKLQKVDEYRSLLKRGSVLYVDSKQEKKELLKYIAESNEAFRQIGYNYAI